MSPFSGINLKSLKSWPLSTCYNCSPTTHEIWVFVMVDTSTTTFVNQQMEHAEYRVILEPGKSKITVTWC